MEMTLEHLHDYEHITMNNNHENHGQSELAQFVKASWDEIPPIIGNTSWNPAQCTNGNPPWGDIEAMDIH